MKANALKSEDHAKDPHTTENLKVNDRPHSHGQHKPSKHRETYDPFDFKMRLSIAGTFESQYLPKSIFCPGLELSALFGIQQSKKHFMLGPVFQGSRGLRERHGIKSNVQNIMLGGQLQFGRSLGQRWTLSGGPSLGWRQLKATDLLLEQGIILQKSKTQAFEVQGHVRMSFRVVKGLEVFAGLRFGQAFYLVDRDSLLLGGFHFAGSLGISLGKN